MTTDPPTRKLPCSWIISGSGLLFFAACALAEANRVAAVERQREEDSR